MVCLVTTMNRCHWRQKNIVASIPVLKNSTRKIITRSVFIAFLLSNYKQYTFQLFANCRLPEITTAEQYMYSTRLSFQKKSGNWISEESADHLKINSNLIPKLFNLHLKVEKLIIWIWNCAEGRKEVEIARWRRRARGCRLETINRGIVFVRWKAIIETHYSHS